MSADLEHERQALRLLLTEQRRNVGLTQEQLAHRVGRAQSYVAKIERGGRRVDLPEFVQLVRAMKLGPVALLRRWSES